ncbi:LuxR C-terminal-related transcriptional regulator [Nocardioides sp. GY 10113]|uniref:LuxR C-terminal-related transcriptional regulator n=1 Tax=Nocardioides sp. GY 10113 TaxID=2569761 RepID=UPI00145865AF|nr:LuxR C-terminal-related transcriptional regulator [Nocardioides sp. GY 10113]
MPDLAGHPPPSSGQGGATSLEVVVVSDQALIAEAVAAALRATGLEANAEGWAAVLPAGTVQGRQLLPVGIALIESDHTDMLTSIRELVERGGVTRWIVLTAVPPGPLWGAALEAGATLVMPRSSSLDQVVAAARGVASGGRLREVEDAGLRSAWERARGEREQLLEAFASLTRSEREVLDQLYAGRTVQEIADSRDVAVVTVRHQVRSVLRKLGVSSQLAAVARYARLREGGPGASGTAGGTGTGSS